MPDTSLAYHGACAKKQPVMETGFAYSPNQLNLTLHGLPCCSSEFCDAKQPKRYTHTGGMCKFTCLL